MDGDSPDIQGLSEKEAAARLKSEGPNNLPQADRRTFIRIVLEILREPMFALLLGAAAIYLVLGDLKEAIVLGIFACTSVLIAVVQESRTERVLKSLRDLTSPRALVIRDGVEKRVAGAEVVRGDLVILAEGDRIPADATVLTTVDRETPVRVRVPKAYEQPLQWVTPISDAIVAAVPSAKSAPAGCTA